VISDPQALPQARIDLAGVPSERLSFAADPYEAARGAHAIAVLTDWKLYRSLDYERIFASMNRPAFIFDGRNALDRQRLFEIGFDVYAIGKRPLTHA
jgi:UDPglucose 6-dehydrogenase